MYNSNVTSVFSQPVITNSCGISLVSFKDNMSSRTHNSKQIFNKSINQGSVVIGIFLIYLCTSDCTSNHFLFFRLAHDRWDKQSWFQN